MLKEAKMGYYQNIRALCASKNLPIGKLESMCGFIQGTIARWSRNVPQIDKLEKVADVLGCTIDELCGREPPENPHDDQLMLGFMDELRSQREDFSDDERTIVRKFRSLSDADKYSVLMMIMRLESKKEDQ
jgi:transcriptional regulator with XRE-family HTH domain